MTQTFQVEPYEENLVTQNEVFIRLIENIKNTARLDFKKTFLILGETGTGKEVLANLYSKYSPRKKYLPININDIPKELFESELFGHKKGSFTGAESDKEGLIESMDSGILFLDEIGDLPYHLQTKLLRAVREQQIRRVGESETRNIDVVFIFATNVDIFKQEKFGKFREDLIYRMGVPTVIPPLRNRKDDIPLLWNYFLQSDPSIFDRISTNPLAIEALKNFDWPGNIAQLKHIAETVLTDKCIENLSRNNNDIEIRLEDVDKYIYKESPILSNPESKNDCQESYNQAIDRFKRSLLSEIRLKYGNQYKEICKSLNISKAKYYRECERLKVV